MRKTGGLRMEIVIVAGIIGLRVADQNQLLFLQRNPGKEIKFVMV